MLKIVIHGQRKKRVSYTESMSLKQQIHRELGQNPLGPAQQTSKHPVLPREGEKNLQLTKQTKQKQHHSKSFPVMEENGLYSPMRRLTDWIKNHDPTVCCRSTKPA